MAITSRTDGLILCSGADTYTLPTAASKDGNTYRIKNTSAASLVTVNTTGGQTIDGAASKTILPGGTLTVVADAGNWLSQADRDSLWLAYTPLVTLVGGAGNVVPQYATNTGRYCKVGGIVFVEIWLDGPAGANGAGTGQITLSLPLTAGAAMVTDFKPGGHFHNGAQETQAFIQIAPSAAVGSLFQQTSATQTSAATGADQNNAGNRTIRLSFFYEID